MTYIELLTYLLGTIETILTHYAPAPSSSAISSMWDKAKIEEYLDGHFDNAVYTAIANDIVEQHLIGSQVGCLKHWRIDIADIKWGLNNGTSEEVLRRRLSRMCDELKMVIESPATKPKFVSMDPSLVRVSAEELIRNCSE